VDVGVSQPRRGSFRFDLRGRQRAAYLRLAAACAAAGTAEVWLASFIDGFWLFASLGALLLGIAAYYARVAYGWVVADRAGLRTSRLVLGRHIPWANLVSVTTDTYFGKAGTVTVVKVHIVRGRRIHLPAPRTTLGWDREFDKATRRLQQLADSH
jgi:hypothetical protein